VSSVFISHACSLASRTVAASTRSARSSRSVAHRLDCQRGGAGDLCGQRQRCVPHLLLLLDEDVRQPQGDGLGALHTSAGVEKVRGLLGPDEAGQGFGETEAGVEAQPCEIGTEAGLGARHAEVGREGEPESAPDCRSMDSGHHGLLRSEQAHRLLVEVALVAFVLPDPPDGEVGTGGERLALGGENGDRHAGAFQLSLLHRIGPDFIALVFRHLGGDDGDRRGGEFHRGPMLALLLGLAQDLRLAAFQVGA